MVTTQKWVLYGCFWLLSCGTAPTESTTVTSRQTVDAPLDTPAVEATPTGTDNSLVKEVKSEEEAEAPLLAPIKEPSGVYRFVLPGGNGKILQTIAFNPGSFYLQEEYLAKKDSLVVTEGTWAPSEGFIWIYKDQIARGRYTWSGDTLQYYSPRLKKTFAMQKLKPVAVNDVWQARQRQGDILYGVGNEPFWSLGVTRSDTLVLNMPEWKEPLRAKVAGVLAAKDSTVYSAANDSVKVVVYPFFCSDGMSDFVYTHRVKLLYKNKTYRGCAEFLQQMH